MVDPAPFERKSDTPSPCMPAASCTRVPCHACASALVCAHVHETTGVHETTRGYERASVQGSCGLKLARHGTERNGTERKSTSLHCPAHIGPQRVARAGICYEHVLAGHVSLGSGHESATKVGVHLNSLSHVDHGACLRTHRLASFQVDGKNLRFCAFDTVF